jgi:hypothetical protein
MAAASIGRCTTGSTGGLPGRSRAVVGLTDAAPTTDVGELLQTWVGVHLDTVDALMAEAHAKVAAIPDRHVLLALIGELVIRLAALELEVAKLRKAVGR